MKGTRKYADESGELHAHKFEAGDYGFDPFVKIWYAMTPNKHLANLGNHQIIEEKDGSITVLPSILVRNYQRDLYHGYLTKGVWHE